MARENLRLGDCEVYFDKGDGNGEVFLGQTVGGVEFNYEATWTDMMVDKFGTALDKALTAESLTVKAMLAEFTKSNLSYAIPTGDYDENSGDSKLGLGHTTGALGSDYAGALRLHPRKNSPSERGEDVYIFQALATGSVPFNFKNDEQRAIEVTWEALADESQPEGHVLGRVGDPDIS